MVLGRVRSRRAGRGVDRVRLHTRPGAAGAPLPVKLCGLAPGGGLGARGAERGRAAATGRWKVVSGEAPGRRRGVHVWLLLRPLNVLRYAVAGLSREVRAEEGWWRGGLGAALGLAV